MRKRGLFLISLIVISLFMISFSFAQEITDDEQKVDDAYQCLEDRVGTCEDLTTDELSFSILALGDHESCLDELIADSRDQNDQQCWPSGNCKLKDTAIALLALDRIGEDTENVESWLLNQTTVASDLTWFIEIDADSQTSCQVTYDSSTSSITINEDKTIAQSAGNCLPVSSNGYWLEIDSNCLDKEYQISCDQDFKSTLLYKTQSSPTIHVSSNIHSASANGQTNEKILFECFKEGTVCNYEGSLWASLALNKKGYPTSRYIPYLQSFLLDQPGFFPEVFMYILTSSNDYLTSIIADFNGMYWQVGTFNKEYNTALAFLALDNQDLNEVAIAKSELLNDQGSDGCFGTTKDTAFLLYSGWPNDVPTSGGGDDGGSSSFDCESFGNFCESSNSCLTAGGSILHDFSGCSISTVCCSVEAVIPSCIAQGGFACRSNEVCNSNVLTSSDAGTCCARACDDIPPTTDGNECEDQGLDYTCRASCLSDETSSTLSCSGAGVCCIQNTEDSGGISIWVWIFVILIILVIIGIIFRKRLRLFIHRIKNRKKKTPQRKSALPSGTIRPMGIGKMPPRVRPPVPPKRVRKPIERASSRDKELESTLRKLRDMGK